jgi:hypothetical protein
MDKQDYCDLVDFLGGDNPRSPIQAIHDAPMQPGWSTVMVLWYDSEIRKWKLAVWDYCPQAEAHHDPPQPGIETVRFRQSTDPVTEVSDDLNEGYLAFGNRLIQHAKDSA